MRRPCRIISRTSAIGCALWLLACSNSSTNTPAGTGGTSQGQSGGSTATGSGGKGSSSSGGSISSSGGNSGSGGQTGASAGGQTTSTGGRTTSSGGQTGTSSGGQTGTSSGGQTGTASGGQTGAAGGQTGSGGRTTSVPDGGASSGSGGSGTQPDGGGATSSCTGKAWPTGVDPSVAGSFQVTADKNVGPAAGATPDPVYGNTQQHFNVYRPTNLATSGYCHPIILWGNGHTDNPEPNPPSCLASNYCGDYLTLMNQLASHGFVVVASLSTITSQLDPATGLQPQLVGMNWILQQAEDPTSPYYHHLDTAHIGAAGHSEGAMATSVIGSDPHIVAIATMAGATATPKLHEPALFLCGGQDTVVPCSNIQKAFDAITTTPVMLEENPSASHGSWIGSIKDPYQVAVTGWMRVHLMNDTGIRNMFYGASCTLCQNAQLKVQRKNMDQ